MRIRISPKSKRNILRIIPFGIIWLLAGWVFIMVEVAAMGTSSPDSPTIINLTLPVFIFASIAVFFVGLLVGLVEMVFVENLFKNKSFLQKIIYKLLLYTGLMFLINCITYPIAASFELDLSLFDQHVWDKFLNYLTSETFLSTLLQMASSILLCMIYAGMSENIGHSVLVNFFTGKYHTPREEGRIFMFLDMKSSTTFAEKLGHTQYFIFLRSYYSDLSNAIINHLGEVYQYIGDEVVISWKYNTGFKDNNCVKCFFAMKRDLDKRKDFYQNKFGVVPSFKAGMHLGMVTTGEIGALKKDIFFTGDVLNVTSRIQGLCNHYNSQLLISSDLFDRLKSRDQFQFESIGETSLKGRTESMRLYKVDEQPYSI